VLVIGMMRPPPREDLLTLRRTVDDRSRLQLADLAAAVAGGRPDDGLLRRAEGRNACGYKTRPEPSMGSGPRPHSVRPSLISSRLTESGGWPASFHVT